MRYVTPRLDLTGQTFGRLTALEPSGAKWSCRCECGRTSVVSVGNLRSGHTQSCGCLLAERRVASRTKHGDVAGGRATGEYRSWNAMIARCTCTTWVRYDLYGGRGITVCPRWRTSFAAFLEDMGRRPTPRHSLDRIDPNGNYEPGNCRWATHREQCNNKRNNRRIEHGGAVFTATEVARMMGVDAPAFVRRLSLGWSVDRALSQPLIERRKRTR